VIYKDLPQNDPLKRRPDISKAQNVLNWNPRINREEGLKITYDYFLSLTKEELYKKEHNNFENYIKY
jgi:dTDP-glucose 4,6-dehydratase